MARASKHGSCITHPKLGCGCKVCETPNSTAHNAMAELVEFHQYIHSVVAARAARVRLPGNGLVAVDPIYTATHIGTDIPQSRFVGAA